MNARCKFKCLSVKDFGFETKEVEFMADYDKTIPEDITFNTATPSGKLIVSIKNPNVVFIPQKSYYIDITSIDE
jgi:hypothetical protein